jgi:hypothetical protein
MDRKKLRQLARFRITGDIFLDPSAPLQASAYHRFRNVIEHLGKN